MIIISSFTLLIGFNFFLWSIVLNSFLTLLINMFYCSKVIDISVKKQLISMIPVLLISCLTYGSIKLVLHYCEIMLNINEIYKLFISIFTGTVTYFLLSYFFRIPAFFETFKFLKENIK